MFSFFPDHKLCKLKARKTEENICHFCLVRSLVLRCQSLSGRTKFIPNELLAVLQDEVLSDSTILNAILLIQHLASIIPGLLEHFMVEGQGYLKISVAKGDCQTMVTNHLNKSKIQNIPSVLIIECQSGLEVNVEELLCHQNTTWHCKCIGTPDTIFFKSKSGFCEQGKHDIVNKEHFTNVQ